MTSVSRRQELRARRYEEDPVLIDCDSCQMRSIACDDCMVTALLGGAPGTVPAGGGLDIDDGESAALGVLAESGLVPPLRLVVADEHRPPRATGTG